MEAKKLQKRTILKILKQCRENDRIKSVRGSYFLCTELKDLISQHLKIEYGDVNEDISIYIPLFNHSNAVKHADADPLDKGEVPYVWWDSVGNSIVYECNMKRAKFLDWLIEQYSKK